ncbi:hypothetical protein C4571_02380 [Candidatus Parcubacteria bacterium]|nr:MAG: hypothetical protein C4571_02380 [Candidatus Parcubacteria bacterium]
MGSASRAVPASRVVKPEIVVSDGCSPETGVFIKSPGEGTDGTPIPFPVLPDPGFGDFSKEELNWFLLPPRVAFLGRLAELPLAKLREAILRDLTEGDGNWAVVVAVSSEMQDGLNAKMSVNLVGPAEDGSREIVMPRTYSDLGVIEEENNKVISRRVS